MVAEGYVPPNEDARQAYDQLPPVLQQLMQEKKGADLAASVDAYIQSHYEIDEARKQMAELFFRACGTPVVEWHGDSSTEEATPEEDQ